MSTRLKDPLAERDKFTAAAPLREHEDKTVFTIGDLSREFGITLRTIRFYEDKGIVSPHRNGTTRLFGRRDRARLKLALMGKRLGFSLSDIKDLIDLYDLRDGQVTQLNAAKGKFADQITKLEKQRSDIDAAIVELTSARDIVVSMLAKRGADAAE
ncbi:MAG: MerR family DNA-binding transcriptional regulator [Pseudomonadota bacterium]